MKKRLLTVLLGLAALAALGAQDALVGKLGLARDERINRLAFSKDGQAFAAVVFKGGSGFDYKESYLYFKGRKFGPYGSILYETVSDRGEDVVYTVDEKPSGPKTVVLNGRALRTWTFVEWLGFIPGTGDPTYVGIDSNNKLSESRFILGSKIEGPFYSVDCPWFSPDGASYTY